MRWRCVGRKLAFRSFLIVALLATSLVIVSWLTGSYLTKPRRQFIGEAPADLPIVHVSFQSDSGETIKGWHCRCPDSRGIIVLVHGIRDCRTRMVDRARLLQAAGYSSLLIDLQSHGESTGNQISLGFKERHDVAAAVQLARSLHANEPVGVLGISLGGASALLASPLPIDALILESVFPDIEAAIHNRVTCRLGKWPGYIPAELLLLQLAPRLGISRDDLRPIDRIREAGCPVFVISGSDDPHTTPEETVSLFNAATEPRRIWLVEGAGHVDLLAAHPGQYEQQVLTFLNLHLDQSNR
ncbi:MAG: alpha/beta hydrolase [Planctomycetaceae bacterium]|nr:alpha/beta hydrolase [Planctomycetaceae bacterium]